MAKLKIQHAGNIDIGIPGQSDAVSIGVVGGANGLGTVSGSNTILCVANIEYSTGSYAAGSAFIVSQKGKRKFLVANLANTARTQVCVLSNVADANVGNLTSGQMAISTQNSSGNIAIASINNKYVTTFPTNYANTTSYGNFATATRYLASFDAANATVQPGSTSNVAVVANQA